MSRRVPRSALAALLPAALVAGCTSPEVDAAPEPTSLVVAADEAVTGYNASTAAGSGAGATGPVRLSGAGFTAVAPSGELVEDAGFGTAEVLSTDPLAIRYAVAEGVTWSDGEPIDAGDLLLHWAALSGALDTSGVDFQAVGGEALAAVTTVPELDADGRSITLTWDTPSADWEGAFWDASRPGMPAHVVGQRALGLADPQEAEDAVVAAVTSGDPTALAALAAVWNSDFTWSALPDDPALHLASGPYVVTAADASGAVLALREDARDPAPQVDEVVVRVEPDDAAVIDALAGGEVDVAALPADAATAAALAAVAGVAVEDARSGERVQLLLRTGGELHAGVFEDPLVRQALLEVLPRRQVVAELLAPGSPSSQVLGSFLLDPWSAGYADVVAANTSVDHEVPDAAAAQALLAQSGAPAPEVCVLFDAEDERQAGAFALLRDAAAPAGFVLTDCSAARDQLGQPGVYDAALVTTAAPATGAAGGSAAAAAAAFRTGGAANSGGYSDAVVDGLLDQLAAEPEEEARLALVAGADTALWADAAGAPLYEVPSLTATSARVSGVVTAPRGTGVFAGHADWVAAPPPSTEADDPS